MLKYYILETKTLTIPYKFNEELSNIPIDAKIITFRDNKDHYSQFNREIKENVLPNFLKNLTFGHNFNREIKENVLPKSLINLTFGYSFNKQIKENVLPDTLINLIFGNDFNKQINENVLPQSLETLVFGSCFMQEIKENILPKSLQELTFQYQFNQEIKENVLPESLHTINLGFSFNSKIILPTSLKIISMYSHCDFINNLPFHVEELYIKMRDVGNGLDIKYNKIITNLPTTLKKIILNKKSFMHFIKKIPFGCVVEFVKN